MCIDIQIQMCMWSQLMKREAINLNEIGEGLEGKRKELL